MIHTFADRELDIGRSAGLHTVGGEDMVLSAWEAYCVERYNVGAYPLCFLIVMRTFWKESYPMITVVASGNWG